MKRLINVKTFLPGSNQGQVVELGEHALNIVRYNSENSNMCIGPWINEAEPAFSEWAHVARGATR